MSFPCNFCGLELSNKSQRRTHNKSCAKNVEREKNRLIAVEANERHKKRMLRQTERGLRRPSLDPETFAEMYDDMPDGAFFALAEEHGIQPEDFV